ncbi:titin isoform X1 [Lucilia cuprina]|uniref:titin isoform X1 n=1 Tax=Lucilia cuprina TaxID=7375 RepID=UPI001F06187D|nr:titin isoform X1 [Lucilia cuprina]
MELECDLSKINNEELLRKMWQQSEDAGRKKEIRSQLYKLRETRLRDLYQGDIMADNSGFGKDPLATSHGDALADQSFQSLKSKEIRDSLSPTEMKFQSMALNNPNTTGWNVQSSKEVSPDGRGFRAETVATTDGVESINGGIAEFKGRNEQRSSAHHQGDDKNFVKKAMESSNSHLQEKVVIGDENSGRTEVRTSSSKSTTSSQVFQSSSNVEYDDGFPGHQAQPQKYLMDSNRPYQHDVQQQHQLEQQRLLEEQHRYEQQFQQQHQQHVNQQERRTTEQLSTTRQNTEQKNTSQNVQTQETHEQNKRYVDMDKASPEYQQHVQYLMQQPGEIISNTVEYPKPNVKMITTVKRLPDGTIVRNKRYETEELNPTTPSTRTTTTTTNQTQPRRDSQQQPSRNYQPDSAPHSRPSQDMVDSSNTTRYVQDTHTDDVETKFSSIKKSSHKFNTESTSETIQEFDDRYPQGEPSNRPKHVTNDFSTHGFPSVRSNKPTQEYPNERPHTERPTQGFPSQGTPAKLTDAMVPHYPDATDNITERRVTTKDGEVIIVSSEKKRNYKTSSNTERIVETEHVIRDDHPYQQIPDKSQDFTTHGFPSAREPAGQQPKNYPNDRQMQPHEQDFPLDKFSPGPRIVKHRSSPHGDDDVVVVSSQKSRTAKHNTNTERIIEHEIIRDDQPVGYPRIQPNADNSPYNYTVTTPGTPQPEFPGTPRKPNNGDYSTQGFPSVRKPGQAAPGEREPYGDYPAGAPKTPSNDYSTQGFPSVKSPSRPPAGLPSNHNQHPGLSRGSPSQEHPTQGFPSVRTPTKATPTQGYPSNVDTGRPNGTAEQPRATPTSKTQPRTPSPNKYKTPNNTVRETTERVIRKEKEVDSAHRAFAASLRSSSPIDHVRRDSYTTDSHTRHTPRSSVSSTRTFKRDMREGSHDSAPSETSRISTTTITRNTPPRTVGGRTVVTKVVTTKTNQGSNDTLNVTSPRATKSPSPGKTVTTTTTTRTMTSKDVPKVTEKSPTKKPQPPAPRSRSSTPSYNSRKPPTSVMTDDYDDADILKPTSPLSPSSRSRTPQKIGPNDNDKPQDDWQKPSQPDNDERRTVNRETTFEKDDNVPQQPRKPNYEQPNVEWVIVDDVDDYDHDDDDNDSFAPEVVDSKLNVKKTTTKLITQEKQISLAPQRKPKSTTTTTVITKQSHILPSKTQAKPNDRTPLKNKPLDSRTPQAARPQKPLTESKSPASRTPLKTQPKVVDNKQIPKAPKSSVPSYTSPLRRPVPKTTTEETRLRKNLKTSQVIMEKTNKLIEAEKLKRKPQSPERKLKSQTPGYKVTVTEVTQKPNAPGFPGRKPQSTDEEPIQSIPYETDDEPISGRPSYRKPQGIDNEPGYERPSDTDDEPHQGLPHYKQPYGTEEEPNQYIPGYGKPRQTGEEPEQSSPSFRKPNDGVNEPCLSAPGYDQPIYETPGYRKPQGTEGEPNQATPGFRKPQNIYEEPNQTTAGYKKPQEPVDKLNQGSPGFRKPQETVEEPKKGSPALRKPPSPGFKRLQDTFDERSPDYKKPVNFDDEPNQGSPSFGKPQGPNDEPRYHVPGFTKPQGDDNEPNRPSYDKPQQIVEEQITITETSEERYPEGNAPKRPGNKPNQYSPEFYKPRDTDKFPQQGKPFVLNPQDDDYEPGKRTPYDTDEQPHRGSRKPQDIDDEPGHRKPNEQEPGFKQSLYNDKEPNQGTPTFRKPFDTEPKDGLPDYLTPQQVTEEEIIITETSQKTYPGKESPQRPVRKPGQPGSRKPYDLDDEPNNGKPHTPDYVMPEEKPGYRKQPHKPVTKPGDKPLETDEDECITESTTTSQRTVAKHIQKFETNLNKKSPKPPTRTKSPTKKELPQIPKRTTKSPLKETSPTLPDIKPKVEKPRLDKPFETDEDETLVETGEYHINSTQKRIVSERQILEEETTYPEKQPKKPTREVSPTGSQRKPGQKVIEEPIDKHPKTPKHVSPTRTPHKPLDKSYETSLRTTQVVTSHEIIKEHPDQKTPRGISPTRIIKKPEEPSSKRPLSPNKNVSPTRLQKQPEQKSPTKPTDGRPKSPSKHLSSTRLQKKPLEKTPLDDDLYTTTLQTTKIVRDKITKDVEDDEEYPERRPKYDKPRDTDDDETLIKTSEFITNSTQKRVVSDKQIITTEESLHPGRKAPHIPAQRKPGQKLPEEPSNRRTPSPTKTVSPTQKKPHQTIPVDDQTLRKTLRTTEKVTEKLTKKVEGKKYPEEEYPSKKGDKPEKTKPKEGKPYPDQPSDTEEDETVTETCEFITNSTNKRVISEQHIHEFEEPKYPDNKSPTRVSQYPTKEVSPTRKQPGQQQPEEKFKEPTGRRPQSPNKHVSSTRTQKKPNEMTPLDDEETFTTSYTSTKIVKESLMDKEYPKEKFPYKKYDKPDKNKPKQGKSYPDRPSDTEEDEIVTETREFVTKSTNKRVVQELEEYTENKSPKYPTKVSQSPTRGVSPTRKQPGKQQPESTGRRPQSPNKHVSPTRTQKKPNEKTPVDDDETFITSLTTTKMVKGTITTDTDGNEYLPKGRKPQSDRPIDDDENLVETNEYVIKSTQKRVINEKQILEIEESPDKKTPKQKPEKDSKSPISGVSPTRTPKRPGQKLPEEPDLKEPTGKRPLSPTKPVSPTRNQRKPVDETKPKDKPLDTDESETFTKTSERVTSSKTHMVGEKITFEFEKPKSPTRGVSPTRTQKKPGQQLPEEPDFKEPTGKRPQSPTRTQKKPGQQTPEEPTNKRPQSPTRVTKKPTDEDDTFKTTLRTTKTVTQRTTKYVDDKEYPDEETPYKKGDKPKERKPYSDKPSDTDEDETITESSEHYKSSKTCKVTENVVEEFVEPKSPTRGDSPARSQKKRGQKMPQEPTNKRPQSPTRSHKKPGQQTQVEPIGKRPQSPTRSQKKPGQQIPEEPTDKRSQSPTRSQKKPTDKDDMFKTTLQTTKTVTTKYDEGEEYPDQKTPHRKGEKPDTKPNERKPYSEKPSDTDEDETITETSERYISSKTCKITESLVEDFKRPESPTRGVSPTLTQQKPGHKRPEEPDFEEPTGIRPQSPTRAQKKPGQLTPEERTSKRPQSPTRSPKKPTDKDDMFTTTLKTTKTVATKYVDDEEYPDYQTPNRRDDKPDTKPKEHKPYSDKPSDTDEDETITETSERFISSKTCKITESLVEDFKRPESPTRGVSPTRTQQKPGQKQPDFKTPTGIRPQSPTRAQKKPGEKTPEEPTGKRPQSPTRSQKKPTKEDETFKSSLRTTQTVTEKTMKYVDDEENPEEIKSKQRKPYSDKPYETDDEEIYIETIRSTTSKVTEETTPEYDRPKSTTRDVSPTQKRPGQKFPQESELEGPTGKRPQSPTRKQKLPYQTMPEEEQTFTETLRTTQITKENVTKTFEDKEFPEQERPRQPGFREPIEKRPKSPKKDLSPSRHVVICDDDDQTFIKTVRTTKTITEKTTEDTPHGEEPRHAKPKFYKPTETDGDKESETFMQTTEFVIKTNEKPKYPEEPMEEYPGFKKPKDQRFINTSEFIRSEKQTLETDKELLSSKVPKGSPSSPTKERSPSPKGPKNSPKTVTPKDRKDSPTRSPSPKGPKSGPKTTTVDDETFRKTLRTTEIVTEKTTKTKDGKTKPKDRKPGQVRPTDTDDEETTSETEEFLIETCEKRYVTDKNVTSETEEQILSTTLVKSQPQKPQEKTVSKPFTSTYEETVETIEGQTYPEDMEQKPYKAPLEPWITKEVPKRPTKATEQFIETERLRKETPDGAFISKTTEPTSPTTPTFKKKGVGRSDTFEERCRQILGMDTYGDTPGTFKKQPDTEVEQEKTIITKDVRTKEEDDLKATAVFQVKIEDCDEDDEPLSISSVKKTLHKQIHTKEQSEPLKEEPRKPTKEEPQSTKKPIKESKYPKDDENEFVETIAETTTIHRKTPKTKSIDTTEPDSSEPEIVEEQFMVINKETKKSEVKITKKSSPSSSPRSVSPTKSAPAPRSPRNESPLKETPKRKPSKETLECKTNKTSPQKPENDTTTTIKERLRSSTRKTKSPGKQDQVDGSDSSPERSPTRHTERRRSSNISVTTEIIIEHTDSDTPNKKEKSPVPKKTKDSVFKEIIDSTVLPEKLTRRMPVTERKESAPVHRVTNRDKDSKMSRSTSENLIKVKKPEPQSLSPKTTPKTTDHRRPNKCFATKSINLSATERLVNSEDMENVIIDIQHAKSSREPSPDKIVPTPVPAHLDTGKPRYPDVVQEPEDDQPRRKPQVKNIPIFEEESNAYVGCHITEVEKTHKTTYDSLDYEEQILNNPVVEAPPSLDYSSLDKPTYDESLLTVHEKVSKFQNIAERVSKPKASEPFQREFDDGNRVPQDDECLLITKTKSPIDLDDEDEEFARNERIYTTVKLAPTAPQKSPELVRTVSRHISRQNEPESEEQPEKVYTSTSLNDDFVECLVNNKKITKEFEVSHHQQLQQQQKTIETTLKTAEKYQQPKDHDDDHDDDDDELIPHTATHSTMIEERRQKDILSRPSVFDSKNKKPTNTTTTITTSKTPLKCNKSPVKDSEKLRPDNKSRTKPTSAVTNTLTETTTTITTTANKQPKQSPQRKNSDIDYELRGSDVETGVKNIISKQTKVYNSSSGSTKTNDLKKQPTTTTSNKKPEKKHMPVRLTPAKNTDEYDLSADNDEKDQEMIITCDETTNIDFETQVVNEDLTQATSRKIPLTTPHKKQPTSHSSTNSSPTDQTLKSKTKEHVEKLTERNPLKPNTVTTTSIKTYELVERADDIDETVLEPTQQKKQPSSQHPSKTTKMSTTTTDSVAARRSLFESNHSSPSATPTKRTPLTSPMSGRRPSYMDHTKSSLEHTRRDSLEINKTNYSRKPSHPEEEGVDRNSLVKFDVPQGRRATTPRATSVSEDINVEEIFDLEVLERLLETVQSYEVRRRIRAQIRLIKKNQKNELISSTTEVTTKTIKTSIKGSEEPDTVTEANMKTKPETKTTKQTVSKDAASHISSSKKEYIFEEPYMPTTRRSPKPNRYAYEPEKEPLHKPTRSQSPQPAVCRRNAEHERHYESSHHSPEHREHTEVVREYGSRTTKQQYYYKDEVEQEQVKEIRHETTPSRKSPSPTRKPHSIHSSPERRNASPESHKPLRTNERSRSPQTKAPQSTRVTSSRSPDSKTSSSTTVRKSSATYEQQEKISSTKPQTKRITTTTTTITKSKPEDKTPVWADRKNILKAPSSTTPTPKKPSNSTLDSRAGYTKTIKSTTSQKMSSNKSSFVEDDCVTSSYGIGPTDENGLPLFGIRALKKKKPTVEPSETTEVTGYVVEEKYYSDNKTKPTVERKEFIYSTNPEELQKLKDQVEVSTNRKVLKDVELKESRQTALISKGLPAVRSSPEDDFLDSTSKYVRRGSVKEMSEKFIQREASSTVTEKSNNYPKAGLILRTNSRKNSRDAENESDNFESYKTTRVQQHTSSVLADSDDAEHEYEVEEVASRHSGRFITESESECDSIKTQREFKKVTSTSSSSMATRSFLNTQGEEKVITNVSDCLERMRNADNVVEEGDTAEDQEARALLNKFLGASIIMKGVESSLPAGSNRQSKIITTTTTSSNFSDDDDNNDGDNNAKNEVKTTRITKTIKSGSSSTPVTYTTCDIEEIWDEEILKELLEQARTYEERRKIRSRLRELMADREETKKSPTSGDEKEVKAAANVPGEEESSASEYEEIIEEVTDYSEAESEVDDKKQSDKLNKVVVAEKTKKDQEKPTSEAAVTKTAEESLSVIEKLEISSTKQETHTEQVEETTTQTTTTSITTETVEEVVEEESSAASKNDDDDKTDSSEKGESLKPTVHDKQKTPQTMPRQEGNSHSNQSTTNSQKLKSAQTSSNSKITVSESSSMHAPNSNNNKSNKTQKTTSTAPTSSQNPIVTVQTAGRADSTSISNKTLNKNSSSRQMNSNNNNNSNTSPNVNNNNNDSSSLGGSSVVVGSNDSPRQVDRLGVPQKEDSGTESGEDLRLIAAGLRDQLQIQSDSNIIEDVTCALSRLENSLKEGKDISVDTEKRKALLALVARLRAGLTSPEKLAEIAAAMSELDGNEGIYGETSSPEADAHRSNRSRFAKRRNRVNRHTVGVSREELADARRYMEDMQIMGSISQSTTPEANSVPNNSPPQWYPLEKNASSGAILTQSSTPVLQRPKQFVPEEPSYTNRLTVNNGKRRPLSGEYSVTFENPTVYRQHEEPKQSQQMVKPSSPPDDSSKFSRFTNKKHLMKRANTIDLAKTHKYNSEFDTDSDAEDKGPHLGLKRAVQVSVKKRVQNVVPPFEPKTENDRKFLAFINKQSDKPGLGWTTSRSVSNWTNKFGSIKSTFEGGLAGKPPQAPHHVSSSAKPHQSSKLFSQPMVNNSAPAPPPNYITNQQIAMRLQQEAERQAEERRRKLERERFEFERRERDKQERQRQQREMQERERLEREHFERQRREQDQLAAAQHAAILREQEQLAAQQAAANMNVPKPVPINEFKHAPQSVFRPIDNVDSPSKPIYKPIPQLPRNSSTWQSLNTASPRGQGNSLTPNSPNHYGNTKPDNSFITSPPPSSRSPIALPWASKPTVDSSSFKSKANRFEERSKYDNINSGGPFIQRHNSLRSANGNQISEDFRKRPSLPNTCDPYSVRQMPPQQDPLAYLPPPQNISFTYSNLKPKTTYQSYPCLPSAVVNNSSDNEYQRPREDSLTDPHAVPLVLTSSNPSYCPPPQAPPQLQQQPISQPRLPRQFDLASPADSTPTSPSIYTMPQTDCTDDDLDSDCNLLEYHAVSRVMGKPQSQTAVTVGRRTGHVSDDELYGKNSKAAKNLLSTMKSIGNPNGMTKSKAPMLKRSEAMTSPKTCLSPDGRSYQAPIVEPLFPEINKFEANRQPIFSPESKKQTTAPTYPQPAPRKQLGMYKSMENLNRNTNKNQNNFMATTATQQPSPRPYVRETQQPSPKPYVSETQTSYVVTYPVEDTTDDEEFSRMSHKKVLPPSSLDLRRQRNVSENSTGSSTTASMSFSQNLPSPNTSWTSNPIVVDESSNYQSMPTPYQNPHKHLPPSPAEPTYQALSSQVVTSYTNVNQNANYNPPPSDYAKTAAQYEAPPQRQMPVMPAQQQASMPNYGAPAATQLPTSPPMPTTKSSYEAKSQRQLQLQQQHQQQQQYQNNTNQKQSATKPSYGAQTQQPTQHPATERIQKPPITQKPTDYPKHNTKTTTKTATSSSTSTTQEKRSLASMRKTVSEDHHSIHKDQTIINPQHSNISQEMLTRLDQQRERISNDIRRKSLGNALDYQMEKQARYETQNSQEYKSSAPADTPDIVKSSLPKDENQPILKKFGPPQRHHYMPNAYQSPSANTTTSSTVVSTATHSTKIQGKDGHSMTNQTVVKSQQIVNHNKPTVMETPATPQPDDDYIPRNIVFNNVHAFTSMNRRQEDESITMGQEQHHAIRPNKLSKSDSWNQIVMLQNQHVPTNTTKFNQSPTNELRRTKSGHTLALPKMYEAAMTKTDISEKQKTVAAYFSGQKSPTQQETLVEQQTTKRSVINRTKTSEKVSAASRKSLGTNLPIAPGGLQRSATMPHIANLNLLDESNVEDAFEQLMMGS